ncbi:hypothetical protein AMAG_20765 [Allomyces macrogynus ATCC 38327]|uniref:Uncharacterized protein n=1 Tax=Allomyces macrogynus (strain ATCC 38327) TaxID=578462 RepID=A0A0L0TF55_ALLM3|nr:hypothetical protein AMAG_20765 [Allomyces macrogynus ATCC 38327]|eukprot:KNE73330.1 hypothetical protein AMAG_20765 [Allomyces macrogynus ATCC 38327]
MASTHDGSSMRICTADIHAQPGTNLNDSAAARTAALVNSNNEGHAMALFDADGMVATSHS